jgi:glycosyltransferase involved in cell wall biosynthesis
MESGPRISVVIATRDRPSDLDRCLASVLDSMHDAFEVVVVDQSQPASPVPDDPRIVHVPTDTRGKSAALNLGLAAARADLVAFTDDDCTVPADWLARVETLFTRRPDVAMAFGELRPVPHDPSQVFVPPAELHEFKVVSDPRKSHVRGGSGGNMAARRSVFEAIGGYDERIGPGSEFRACEEYDVYYRVLASGQAVAFSPELVTTHWGARSYADGSGQLLKRWYAYGEGAVIGKHLRMGDRRMAGVAARITAEDLRVLGESLRHRRLTGLGQLAYKVRGLARAVTVPVDRRRQVFMA